VRKLLDEAKQRVTVTLTAQRQQLEALAKLLLEKETVDRTMLDAVLSGVEASASIHESVTGTVAS
jgi:cell division protease FtsH